MHKKFRSFFKSETLLLLVALLTSLMWAVLVPIWHFPDVQAHFTQVQNTGELDRDPQGSADLSQEIAESERVLATNRDARGNNSYTGNPSFNLSFPSGFDGAREKQLKGLPIEARKVYVGRESPRYPPLFYWYSSVWYRLVYASDLFTRVLFVRIGSSFLFVGILYFAFKIGQELFPNQKSHALMLATITAFHPMLMFVSSGINNDTLVTVVASALTLACLRLIRMGLNAKRVLVIVMLFALGMFTKQTIFLLVPLVVLSLLATFIKHRGNVKKLVLLLLFAVFGLSVFYALLKFANQGFWLPYWPLPIDEMLSNPALFPSLQSLVSRLYRETLPWYWGVFKWLGVVFPLPLIRVFKLLMVASVVGWMVFGLRLLSKKTSWENLWSWLVLALGNAGYIVGLVAWELPAILRLGFGHGIQGRYFFPLIVSHMALLYFGWLQLVPVSVHNLFNKLLTLVLVSLGIYSLWYVLGLYYSFESIAIFVQQASHYKSQVVKWPMLGAWLATWVVVQLILIIKTITRKD